VTRPGLTGRWGDCYFTPGFCSEAVFPWALTSVSATLSHNFCQSWRSASGSLGRASGAPLQHLKLTAACPAALVSR
jgi:hypothetical protein